MPVSSVAGDERGIGKDEGKNKDLVKMTMMTKAYVCWVTIGVAVICKL
jgi:hypothetical protein